MSNFYAKICSNGHVLVENYPINGKQFCETCGAKMLSKCPVCNSVIKEWHSNDIIFACVPHYDRPLYCKSCGNPYPWTQSALETALLILKEDTELSDLERINLENSLPDIIAETPKTKLASIRVKKALISAGEFTVEALRQFVIDFGCELAIKSIGL